MLPISHLKRIVFVLLCVFMSPYALMATMSLTVHLHKPFNNNNYSGHVVKTKTIEVSGDTSAEGLKVHCKKAFNISVSLQKLCVRLKPIHNLNSEAERKAAFAEIFDDETVQQAAVRLKIPLSSIKEVDLFFPEAHEFFYVVLPTGKTIVVNYSPLSWEDPDIIGAQLGRLVAQAVKYDVVDPLFSPEDVSSYAFHWYIGEHGIEPLAYILLPGVAAPNETSARARVAALRKARSDFIHPFTLFFLPYQQNELNEVKWQFLLNSAYRSCMKVVVTDLPEQFREWHDLLKQTLKPAIDVEPAVEKEKHEKRAAASLPLSPPLPPFVASTISAQPSTVTAASASSSSSSSVSSPYPREKDTVAPKQPQNVVLSTAAIATPVASQSSSSEKRGTKRGKGKDSSLSPVLETIDLTEESDDEASSRKKQKKDASKSPSPSTKIHSFLSFYDEESSDVDALANLSQETIVPETPPSQMGDQPTTPKVATLVESPVGGGQAASRIENRYGVCARQGTQYTRPSEDRHHVVVDKPEYKYFGVYDGHAGSARTSSYLVDHLYLNVISNWVYPLTLEKAIKKACSLTDTALRSELIKYNDMSGSTALMAFVVPKETHSDAQRDGEIVVANVGDCRAVVSIKGVAKDLSVDHKANRPDEVERIQKAGGFVIKHRNVWRVNRELAVSRAFGDFGLKGKPIIISEPEIITENVGSGHEFMILACDGLWDVMTSQEAVNFVATELKKKGATPNTVASMLADAAVKRGSGDDITVVIYVFDK